MASVGTAKEWKSHVWVVTKGSRPLALDLGEKLTFEGPGDGGTESVLKASGKKLGDQWRYDPRAGRVDLYVGVEPYTAEHDGEANPPTLTFRSAVAKGGDLGSGFWMAEEAE